VFFASIFGAGFPVVAKKVKWMKIPPKVFFFCKHFGTGVLIATAFVHVGNPVQANTKYPKLNMADDDSFYQPPSRLSTTHACLTSSRKTTLLCRVLS
jgi:hypothetical protein